MPVPLDATASSSTAPGDGGRRARRAATHARTRYARSILRPITAFALAGGALVVLAAPASAASALLYVSASAGHNTGSCSTQAMPCATITYALAHAAPGATILVAAGTYPEQLTITRNVSIVGRAAGRVVLEPETVVQNDVATDSSVPQFAIVDIHDPGGSLADVNLENLVINGSEAGASSFNSCSDNFPGVYYHDASGLLRADTITGMEMAPDLFGCQTGKGVGALVASDAGRSSTVTMARVTVRAFQKNGLECIDPGTACIIEHSGVTGIGPTTLTAQNGVEIWGVRWLDFMHNKVTGDTYSGPSGPAQATGLLILNAGSVDVRSNKMSANDIDLYAGEDAAFTPVAPAGTWTIRGNRLTGATDDAPAPWNVVGGGYGDGLVLDSTSNDVEVEHNRAGTNFEYGIALYGVHGATVHGNGAHRDADGIYVGGPGSVAAASTGNTLRGNRAFYNTDDGILAAGTGADSGNTFLGNTMHHNGGFEAEDRSTGTHSDHTANFWVHDHCSNPTTVSPAALC